MWQWAAVHNNGQIEEDRKTGRGPQQRPGLKFSILGRGSQARPNLKFSISGRGWEPRPAWVQLLDRHREEIKF